MHWKVSQKHLRFVQRGRILLRCGSALALSLPSLGVSSLDLGRLFTQAALFFEKRYFLSADILCTAIPRHAFRVDRRRAIAHHGESLPTSSERHSILRRPGTVRGRQAE